ncbi:MAG: hypothetical protein ACJA1L_002586 [Paracoccaceae bacterium]|jgi:hypothetical protein
MNIFAAIAFTAALAPALGFAAPLTSDTLSSPAVYDFSAGPQFSNTSGPHVRTIGTQTVTITATGGKGFVDFVSATNWNLGGNGGWNSGRGGFGAYGAAGGSMSFTFAELVSGVGGFFNYSSNSGGSLPHVWLAIYDDADALIESWNVTVDAPISTPGVDNAGAFRGFQLASASIRRFEMFNAYVVIDDLTISSVVAPAVPLPAAGVLLLGALGALGLVRRRG